MSQYQKIIVAIDLSEESNEVVERALGIAGESGAEMHLIHVIEPLSFAYGGDIPMDHELRASLIGVEYGYTDQTTGERLRLERKADMKKRGLDSPDEGDALAYTFYHEVAPNFESNSFEPDEFEPEY